MGDRKAQIRMAWALLPTSAASWRCCAISAGQRPGCDAVCQNNRVVANIPALRPRLLSRPPQVIGQVRANLYRSAGIPEPPPGRPWLPEGADGGGCHRRQADGGRGSR